MEPQKVKSDLKKNKIKKVGEMFGYGSGSDGWALTLLMR